MDPCPEAVSHHPFTARQNYRQIPWQDQTLAERMEDARNACDDLARNSDVEAADESPNYLADTAIGINRKRRHRNCCQAGRFKTEWLRAGNPIANRRNPALNFTRHDFAVLPRSQVFTVRGFNHQYFVTGDDLKYRASGGGTSQWADGEESARCYMTTNGRCCATTSPAASNGGHPGAED